jgi:hypothetical protein
MPVADDASGAGGSWGGADGEPGGDSDRSDGARASGREQACCSPTTSAPGSPSPKAPYQMQFADQDDDMLAQVRPQYTAGPKPLHMSSALTSSPPHTQHLRAVFEELCVDGSKEVLFVRACAPTVDKRPEEGGGDGFEPAVEFKDWQPPEVQVSVGRMTTPTAAATPRVGGREACPSH